MKTCGRVIVLLALRLMAAQTIEVPNLMLNNGRKMPALALGTYLGFDENGIVTSKDGELKRAVEYAIEVGYRHIDTAAVYTTEREVGEAVKGRMSNGTVAREDVFITTKLWNTHHKRAKVLEAAQESLNNLGLEYIDLYLMHWPIGLNEDGTESPVDYLETWRGMEDVHKLGLAKSIGLSNFNRSQLERILDEADIKPVALQIEVHPNLAQRDLVEVAQSRGLLVMGYSPFGFLTSRMGVGPVVPNSNDPILTKMANKYGKSTYQIALRWLVERRIVPIPKSTNRARLLQNIDIFDFKLTSEEITKIGTSYERRRVVLPSFWQDHPFYPFEKIDKPIPNPFVKNV